MRPEEPLAGGTVLQNRYAIEEPIGEGGMGRVYKARALHLSQTLAVKEFKGPSPDDPGYASHLKAFRSEAELLAGLHHAHLPRVVDFFEEGGRHYLVMDYVEGPDLRSLLGQERSFPLLQVIDWGVAILETLDYLHTRKPPIVVRDLKPSNLIRTPSGEIVLVDFGIARSLAQGSVTHTLAAGMGTPGYAPPEQYASGNSDPRGDLYALGATMYHLLTGQLPTESVHIAAGLAEQPPPSHFVPIPPQLEAVVMRAMSARLSDRYPDAASMRLALLEARQHLEQADIRASAADRAGLAERVAQEVEVQPRIRGWTSLLHSLRARFARLGWEEHRLADVELALKGPGLLAPMLLLKVHEGILDEAATEEVGRALLHSAQQASRAPRTFYLVIAANTIPNPMAVGHRARELSILGVWRRLLLVPLHYSKHQLVDQFIPHRFKHDNDVSDPLLNLGAALGSLA